MPGTSPDPVISGQLMVIDDIGTMILGDSGIGKTDLCLSLIKGGHAMVADDAIRIIQHENRLYGSAPAELQDIIAVRGLGALCISETFGQYSYRKQHSIDLAVQLYQPQDQEWSGIHALKLDKSTLNIQQVAIPSFRIPVGNHRNLVHLIETLVSRYGHCKAPID